MASNILIYWDANIFLAYFNGEPDRIPILEAIIENVSNNDKEKIVTSVLSKVEVAWVTTEKNNKEIDKNFETLIDNVWNESSFVEIVEFNDDIAYLARSLLREAMTKGWSLKTNDAIHLATAKWVGAIEMNTYDDKLYKYKELTGIEIKAPTTLQPKLL